MQTQADIARIRAAQATPAAAQGTTVRQAAASQRQAQIERDAGIDAKASNVTSIAPPPVVPPAVTPPAPTAIVPPEITTPENPLQSTTAIEQQETGTRQSAQERMNELDSMQSSFDTLAPTASDYTAFGDTAGGAAAERKMSAAEQEYADVSAGRYNEQQQQRIDAATERARIAGEETVRGLEAQKKQGMAKSTVNAGEAGGFLNTQFAGIAALLPTQGNTFVGAGGELERIQSSYDGAIASAKNATLVAMEDARAATEEALRTGELADLEIADRAYDRAKTSYTEAQTLQRQKREDLINFETTRRELLKYQKEDMSLTFDAFIADGKTVDDIPEWYFEGLDAELGYAQGTSRGLYSLAEQEKHDADFTTQLDQASKLNDILTKLPVGKSISLGGVDYTSLNQGKVSVFSEDDGNGNTTIVSYNEDTGAVSTTTLAGVSKKDGWEFQQNNGVGVFVNPNTQQVQVAYDSNQPNNGVAHGGLIDAFPEGSTSPFSRPGGLDAATECGAWVNDVTGIGVGDTYQSKVAVMDPGITEENADIGDVFIEQAGTTGHVGIINGKSVVNGQVIFTVSESNWSKQPGTDGKVGLITHTRQVPASEITGYARPGFVDPNYNFGTDAVDSLRTFGSESGSAEPIIKEINGQDLQWDPSSSSWITPYGSEAGQEEARAASVSLLEDKISSISDIRDHKGFNNAVGAGGLFQRSSPFGFQESQRRDFISRVQELTSEGTLEQLVSLKAKGGTLGALSDSEGKLLRDAASRLDSYAKTDKQGNVEGYQISQAQFLDALNEVNRLTNRALINAQGLTPPAGEIFVQDKDGNVGSIPASEYDSDLYLKI